MSLIILVEIMSNNNIHCYAQKNYRRNFLNHFKNNVHEVLNKIFNA